jgi:plastocyanin
MKIISTLLLVGAACIARVAFAQSSGIDVRVDDGRGHPVADAVVVAVPPSGNVRVADARRENVVDQVDKEFVPRVLAVLAGTPVMFPNHDHVRHHVYSFSPAKRFELPLYAGVPAKPVVFDTPGVVVLGCNIHDWMVGYVYVSESPYFAKTSDDGKARLRDMPPGAYVVRVWHPQLAGTEEATQRTIDVPRGRVAEATWTLDLKPEVRIRRAPMPGMPGHY